MKVNVKQILIYLVIAFVIVCLLPGPSSKVAAIPIVALVTPPAMPAPAAYGAERLRKALAARGFRVVDGHGPPL